MRAFAWFVGAIAFALLGASLLAWPAYLVIHPHVPAWWFDKIATRLFDVLVLIALIYVARRLRATKARDWGYQGPAGAWLRDFGAGLAAGVVTMLPVALSMLAIGLRVPNADLSLALARHVLLAALGSGLLVGLAEESVIHGLMQGAVIRDSRRPLLAIGLVALVFSSVHFFARARIAHESVTWHSGLDMLTQTLAHFAAPGTILDSFLSLAAIGVLTGLITWWTGRVAYAAGLHAGWVWIMLATTRVTRLDTSSASAWLVSRSDGFTGWLVLAWTLVIIGLALALRGWLFGPRRAARA